MQGVCCCTIATIGKTGLKRVCPDGGRRSPGRLRTCRKEIRHRAGFTRIQGHKQTAMQSHVLYLENCISQVFVVCIVCVNEQDREFAERFNYFNIENIEDQEDRDAMQHFSSFAEFINNALASGDAVCFYCFAGISRSSTVMIAYLMSSKRMNVFQAFEKTYNARRVTWLNRTFMEQLIEYEHELQLTGVLPEKKPSLK
jgi:protein-tyrosine phosphatase